MKALSLWQPWASLIAVGAKRLETRSWFTAYRGPLAIHAAARWTLREQLVLREPRFFDALKHDYALDDYDLPAVPRGAIVAVGMLTDCVSTNRLAELPGQQEDEFWFGNFMADRWMWRIEGVQKLEIPVRCPGQRGLWELEPHILERLQVFV